MGALYSKVIFNRNSSSGTRWKPNSGSGINEQGLASEKSNGSLKNGKNVAKKQESARPASNSIAGASKQEPMSAKQESSMSLDQRPEGVEELLERIALSKYMGLFTENGFEDMETFLEIDNNILSNLKIVPGHQIKIMKEINRIKALDKKEEEESKNQNFYEPLDREIDHYSFLERAQTPRSN